VNRAPTAESQAIITPEDTPVAVTLKAIDPEGDRLTYSLVTPPAHGMISGSAPNLTYKPVDHYKGPDSFTFKANDGSTDGNVAVVAITVSPVNHAPVAGADSALMPEDTPVNINVLANDFDVDGDALKVVATTTPSHGTVIMDVSGVVRYTPNPNYHGPDSFTYTVSDGKGGTAIGQVSINILSVNKPPIADNLIINTNQDRPATINLPARDVDDVNLSFSIVTGAAHGTLSPLIGNKVIYTPAPRYRGPDSFTFRASDSKSDSNVAVVYINIAAIKQPPIAVNDAAITAEDKSIDINVLANDLVPEQEVLKVIGVAQGAHGTVAINPDGSLKYTPQANFSGSDSFTYTEADSSGGTSVASVSVTIVPVNKAPVASNGMVTTNEDTPAEVTLVANDVDSPALTYRILSGPFHGSLSAINGNKVTYIPAPYYHGPDTFTFIANDGMANSNLALVNVTINPVNHAPVAGNDAFSALENTPLDHMNLLANDTDVDGDALKIIALTPSTHGTATLNTDGTVRYVPNPDFHGTDTFTYTISDDNGGTSTGTVTINVAPVNHPPVASGVNVTTNEDVPVEITLAATDVDSPTLTFSIVTAPSHGKLSTISGTKVVYTPNRYFHGQDSFAFRASDGQASSNTAAVSVTVIHVNNPPVLAPVGDRKVSDGEAVSFTLKATDPDNDTLTFSAMGMPTGATLNPSTGAFSWTPSRMQLGNYRITFSVTDPGGLSDSHTVTISVLEASAKPAPERPRKP
jgi:hypothetical protein